MTRQTRELPSGELSHTGHKSSISSDRAYAARRHCTRQKYWRYFPGSSGAFPVRHFPYFRGLAFAGIRAVPGGVCRHAGDGGWPPVRLRVNDRFVSSNAYVLLAALGGSLITALATVGAVFLTARRTARVNARDFRCFRLFGVLWSSCPVSVLVPVFPVALAVSGHGGCPRIAAGLARGSTVRVPRRAGGSSFLTGCFPGGG